VPRSIGRDIEKTAVSVAANTVAWRINYQTIRSGGVSRDYYGASVDGDEPSF